MGGARVEVRTRPMWRIRLARELPRTLLMGASLAGLLASARFAIAPPRPAALAHERALAPAQDLAAEGFAQLFARRYLTFKTNEPEARQRALAPFAGPNVEAGFGVQPPPTGGQQVLWTEVVQERVVGPDERIYTVAVQTTTSAFPQAEASGLGQAAASGGGQTVGAGQTEAAGLVYLAVAVARTPDGVLRIAGYPAFVGAPAAAAASIPAGASEVTEPLLRTVVERALRNYLAGSSSDLAADLSAAASVSLPSAPLTLEALQHLTWSPEGAGAVVATVQAQDPHGARYTLAYDLDVVQVAGRWEIAAIEMDPDT